MRDGQSILVVVPARGGSKGVPRKNLREVRGVSLVGLVGHVVAALGYVDRAVVSTDDESIAEEAERVGLAAPFRRSPELSGDLISDWQVLIDALRVMERLDGWVYNVVLMLQPTSPFRTPSQVTATLDHLLQDGFDSVWSVSKTDTKAHPLKQIVVSDDGTRRYYDPAGARIIARQQLSPVYHRNGVAYAFTRDCLLTHGDIEGKRRGAYMISEPVVNIDSESDFALAEFLIERHGLDWLGDPARTQRA